MPTTPLPPAPFQLRNLTADPDADNLGGLEAFWLLDVADLLSWPSELSPLTLLALHLRPTTVLYRIDAIRGTLRYTQDPKQIGRHGDGWQQRVRGTIARHTDALAAALEALHGRRLIALTRDQNGLMVVVGAPDEPLSWQDKFDTGTSPADRNNYDFTLEAVTSRRARPFLGSFQVASGQLITAITTITITEPGGGSSAQVVDLQGNVITTIPAGKKLLLDSSFQLNYALI